MDQIQLHPEDLIHRGANRACYFYPGDPSRCIKVDLARGDASHAGTNAIEGEFHAELSHRLGEAFLQFAPRGYGWVVTDQGRGLVFEVIRESDGELSPRLADAMAGGLFSETQVMAMVQQLRDFLLEHRVWLFDVNLYNLLVHTPAEGEPRLVCIDWKGPKATKEALPLARYVGYFAKKKLNRRFDRLVGRVKEAYANPDRPPRV